VPVTQSLSFCVLTSPSLSGLQPVGACHAVAFFPCADKSLPLGLQLVGACRSVAFSPCADKSHPLWSPVGECPSLCRFLSMSQQVPPSVVQGVSACHPVTFSPCSNTTSLCGLQRVSARRLAAFFCVLTGPSLCGLQEVSACHMVTVFLCPDKSPLLWSPGSEHPSLSLFLSMS